MRFKTASNSHPKIDRIMIIKTYVPRALSAFTITMAVLTNTASDAADRYLRVLAGVRLPTGSTILGIKLHVAPGHLVGISGIPAGWKMVIDNDPSNQISISGGGSLASSAFSSRELEGLNLVIEQYEKVDFVYCQGKIVTTANFEGAQTIDVTKKHCSLKKIGG
jgi:hypothetical protein